MNDIEIVREQYMLNALWVLLPLVPAVVIYLIFPKTQTRLSGPFKGLSLRTGGAFAAYMIVFLATLPLVNKQNANIDALLKPTWHVTGKIRLEDGNGTPLRPDFRQAIGLAISFQPEAVRIRSDGRFDIDVPAVDGAVPTIEARYPGFAAYSLDPYHPQEGEDVTIDTSTHAVAINSPLVLRKQACQSLTIGENSLC